MNRTATVIVIVLVLLALLAVAWWLWNRAKQRRTEQLRGRFGPEYDRAVDESGDRRAAESHLAQVADRREGLEIRDLSEQARVGYTQQWRIVQADFVDSPSAAVRDADRLIGQVMRERGYPVDDFDTRADMIAADHPQVVEHYRAAQAGTDGDPTTEEQRRAFVHYRALFVELVGPEDDDAGTAEGRHAAADTTTDGPGDTTSRRSETVDLTDQERTRSTTRPEDGPPAR